MDETDPLPGTIERLRNAVTRPVVATAAGGTVSVEVGADGGLRAIRLTEHGRRLDPDTLVAVIVRLHAAALTESRTAVAQAVAELEADPRLRLRGAQIMDALRQPVPRGEVEVRGRPDRPAASRQPTPEEEDEMDRYYQRKSWLV